MTSNNETSKFPSNMNKPPPLYVHLARDTPISTSSLPYLVRIAPRRNQVCAAPIAPGRIIPSQPIMKRLAP